MDTDEKASMIERICLWLDSMAVSDHSIPASGLAPNKMNSRTVSAPYLSTMSPGLTVFPSDLLILADLEPSIVPQVGHSFPSSST